MTPAPTPAVITGASSGIGAETARVLARAGHPIAIGARRVDRLDALAEELRAEGATVVVAPLDVTDTGSVTDFEKVVTAELGGVGVLVCNAGHIATGASWQTDPEEFDREVAVNLFGVQRLLRAFLPAMIGRGTGDVVLVSSDTALRSRPYAAAYSTAKWGLEGLAQALHLELEGTGVRASVVRPGGTATEAGADWDAEAGLQVIESWQRAGIARHPGLLHPSALADMIGYIVAAPRGVNISCVDVNPEAPRTEAPR
ncbi:SDR family oxidoreductase [Nocardioides sp. YIM 152588]|uniref:SDR family oxidoreductase n=1 Tax=Nocardioides sp. YIM 152588 TaxID=3158259 RepID=UPI0032E403D2